MDSFQEFTPEPEDTLVVRFLEEGGRQAIDVAGWLADYLSEARRSLDLAFYDARLSDGPARLIQQVLAERAAAGVRIRLVYDAGPKPQSGAALDVRGADLAPTDTHERVEELGLDPEAIVAVHAEQGLMHHKYVVRDEEAVWTGSLNLTDDSMTRMENLVVTLQSPALARFYARDFGQLWETAGIVASGAFPTDPQTLRYGGSSALVDVDFSPGQGQQINEWVAERVLGARRRIVICSMLLNSSKLLQALTNQLDRGQVEISGVYDRTQMLSVLDQWQGRDDLTWKRDAVERVIREARLVGKNSLPYHPGRRHNFMHAKTLVVDDSVITGSYNLSHAAQGNAENMLAIDNPLLAERVTAFVRHLAERFGRETGGRREK